MARAPRPFIAAAAAAALLLGCKQELAPVVKGPTFALSSGRAVGQPTRLDVATEPGAEAVFTGGMTHPGMVPIVAKASEEKPGLYVATMTWTMAGDWVVFFEAQWPDGRRKESKVEIRVAQ